MATYDYNSEGLRTKKTTANGVENYVYFSGDLEYITDENNNLKYSFIHDNDGRYVGFADHTTSTPTVYHYVLNYRGDVIGIKDASGNMVVTYSYDNFGNILTSTGTVTLGNGKLLKEENPIRYASYYYDIETSLYYVKARYYNAEIGRFTSRDPVFQDNLYAYADNNPVFYVDTDGNNPVSIVLLAGMAMGMWTLYDIYKNPSVRNIAYNLIPLPVAKFLKPFEKELKTAAKKVFLVLRRQLKKSQKIKEGPLERKTLQHYGILKKILWPMFLIHLKAKR